MDGPDDEMGLGDDVEGIEEALRDTMQTDDAATPPPATEGATVKKKTAATPRKRAASKPRAEKKAKAPKAPKTPKVAKAEKPKKPTFETVPTLSELKLSPNGVRKSEKNRYVNIEFTNGFSVRLFPLGFKPADVQKVTDLIVAVLNR